MKIVKLTEEHYILVDDSEIKVGDIVAEKLLTGGYELFEIHTQNDIDKTTQKVITHSTQPLENINFVDEAEGNIIPKIKPLPLSEVKELLGVVDVEKKAEKWHNSVDSTYPDVWNRRKESYKAAFESGYYQSLEDNKERKYTKEDMWAMLITGKQLGLAVFASIINGSDKPNQEQYFNECIESRDSSTEWECIIDEQGKLKLI
jgi:hypothetical protein